MSRGKDKKLLAGLVGAPLEALTAPALPGGASRGAEHLITDVRYVGSYDVVNKTTIIVPGSPPVWSPPTAPFSVAPDTRALATERNEYKLGSPMFESVFASIDAVGTDVKWPEVDLVTNRRALRHLYRWLDGANSKPRDNFRIDVDLFGDRTMLFSEVARTFQFDDKHPGFGARFEVETTDAVPGCEASKGHHRIVRYNFGGLNLVVRFECDARVDMPSGATSSTQATEQPYKPNRNSPYILRAGAIPAQDAIVEIKTTKGKTGTGGLRQTWPSNKWTDVAAQLLLSGTERLHTGMHVDGNFYVVEEHEVDKTNMLAERPRVANCMRRLGSLLGVIRERVLARGREAKAPLSIVCQSGQLRLYERTSRRIALAEEFTARFSA
ncbi:unnamed protein product [Peniophora sp. CBMAI 1063]|nr:unnamed protein product [Peniophora sp. CBMAI 1063]